MKKIILALVLSFLSLTSSYANPDLCTDSMNVEAQSESTLVTVSSEYSQGIFKKATNANIPLAFMYDLRSGSSFEIFQSDYIVCCRISKNFKIIPNSESCIFAAGLNGRPSKIQVLFDK